MATTVYTATVQENGSLTLSSEAREALRLQPGDKIEIRIDEADSGWGHDELCAAIDVGIEQLKNGQYTVYTKDTLHEFGEKIVAQGRRLRQHARTNSAG